jgi:hypothetical protein
MWSRAENVAQQHLPPFSFVGCRRQHPHFRFSPLCRMGTSRRLRFRESIKLDTVLRFRARGYRYDQETPRPCHRYVCCSADLRITRSLREQLGRAHAVTGQWQKDRRVGLSLGRVDGIDCDRQCSRGSVEEHLDGAAKKHRRPVTSDHSPTLEPQHRHRCLPEGPTRQ